MYPSGAWRGYWEQKQYGKQFMEPLTLHFASGRITGAGHDLVGDFTFAGAYDDQGGVRLVKHYVGRHLVYYEGQFDGEGTIHGHWSIPPFWTGTFALSPLRDGFSANDAIHEIVPADAAVLV